MKIDELDAREVVPMRPDPRWSMVPFVDIGTSTTAVVWVFLTLLAMVLCGCDDWHLPSAARTEAMARDAAQAGDYPQAVRVYEAMLDGTPQTADIHFHLALIYDDKLADPVSALHHYRRYLRMGEDEKRKAEVSEYVKRTELVLATRSVDSGIITKREAARLRNENLRLEELVSTLRDELGAAKRKPDPKAAVVTTAKPSTDNRGFSTNATTRAAEQAVGTETRTYVVQKGDTLASISRKFYSNAQRWKDIADANHNQLDGTVNLKVGQSLIIPK
jgi:nucleoid-associated protein YgaU